MIQRFSASAYISPEAANGTVVDIVLLKAVPILDGTTSKLRADGAGNGPVVG